MLNLIYLKQLLFSDGEAPIIACPDNQTNLTVFGQSTAAVVWTEPEASDNSGQRPYISCSRVSGSQFEIGQTQVICKANDGFGNWANCTFTVEVKGNIYQLKSKIKLQ